MDSSLAKARSVREILTEMKDCSELIVDLAYSAIVLNDRELAEEVLKLEEEIDQLSYEIKFRTLLASENPKDAEKLIAILMVATSIDEISDAAADIAKLVLKGFETHPIILEAFKYSDEHIVFVEVKPSSAMEGKDLRELALPTRVGAKVIAVKRRNRWFYAPEDKFKLHADDLVVAKTTLTAVPMLKELCGVGGRG